MPPSRRCGGSVLRVVLDTVVFVRVLINPKSRTGRLLLDYAGQFTLIVSEPTVRELLEVIRRPELAAKYKGIDKIDAGTIIDLVVNGEALTIHPLSHSRRDPHAAVFAST